MEDDFFAVRSVSPKAAKYSGTRLEISKEFEGSDGHSVVYSPPHSRLHSPDHSPDSSLRRPCDTQADNCHTVSTPRNQTMTWPREAGRSRDGRTRSPYTPREGISREYAQQNTDIVLNNMMPHPRRPITPRRGRNADSDTRSNYRSNMRSRRDGFGLPGCHAGIRFSFFTHADNLSVAHAQ